MLPILAERPTEADEIAGNKFGTLMDQLIERMLTIGARLAPDNRAGLIVHRPAFEIHMFAVALHLQLLQIGWKAREGCRIGHDSNCLRREEIIIPNSKQSEQDRQVYAKRRGTKMRIHRVKAGEHVAEVFRADCENGR